MEAPAGNCGDSPLATYVRTGPRAAVACTSLKPTALRACNVQPASQPALRALLRRRDSVMGDLPAHIGQSGNWGMAHALNHLDQWRRSRRSLIASYSATLSVSLPKTVFRGPTNTSFSSIQMNRRGGKLPIFFFPLQYHPQSVRGTHSTTSLRLTWNFDFSYCTLTAYAPIVFFFFPLLSP